MIIAHNHKLIIYKSDKSLVCAFI